MRKGIRVALIVVICMLAFIVLDLPVRFSKFVNDMPPYLGIKNAVAPATALMVGPWGTIGSVLGAVICGIIDKTATWTQIIYEIVTIVILSLGSWFLWHMFTSDHKVRFKTLYDLTKFTAILASLSAANGVLSFAFVSGGDLLPVFFTELISSMLVGIPAIIIYCGIMCQQPVIPPWYTRSHDIEDDIEANDESFIEFNDKVEKLTMRLELPKKRVFEIINTIEEVYLRIRTHEPEATVHITIDCEDALSILFEYKGEKCNPLRISADEDLVALIGLKLIEHRAIRTSYKYSMQTNQVLIVL